MFVKRVFLFFVLSIFFLSFSSVDCAITITNDEDDSVTLSLILDYGDSNYHYYYFLNESGSKQFDISKDGKKLEKISVYPYPLKDTDDQEITKDKDDKKLEYGSKIAKKIDDKKLLGEALMNVEEITDDGKYKITSKGEGWAEVGAV